ncbi:MAG: Stp1/IreP family PP2C-type Ser/Thr phosphatase [Bacillota bacterium]|nr:Stp1/IreP family PP2C-type Ser/Thr phosphatase [Bacillota bacterium]MDW7682582.1 Stp1/IreP family PP2C-type Ser/Thr phosphatase [Bacillota bacterium]
MKAAGITDRGKVRDNNEDRYLIWHSEPFLLCAVADGMGGHAAGEVASALALVTLKGYLTDHRDEITAAMDKGRNLQYFLHDMLAAANRAVLEEGKLKPERSGMGTTLTMVLQARNQYWVAHIGDSRACLIRNNELIHLTEDHTLVSQLLRNGQISEEESNGHPQRHILTRALGTDDVARFDIMAQSFQPGDKILLSTDGLHGLVEESEILQALQADCEPKDVLAGFVALANERGGHDNITAVLFCVA